MYGRRAGFTVSAVAAVLAALTVVAGAHGQPAVPAAAVADNFVNRTASRPPLNESDDGLKKVMWKRCISKNYVTCVKLALVHLVDRLERANDSYSLVPGVTVSSQKYDDADNGVPAAASASSSSSSSAGRDSSEASDRFMVDRLGRYFGTLTLNVKLLDDATAQSVRKLGEAAADASVPSGRGKKQKYAQSILLAGWVTGAMLLALGMKTIAVLAGKALMTALMSLLLSALASFRGGGHSEPKSTTYEIVTKPVYTHSHSNAADDVHAAGTQNSPTYRRSIGGTAAVGIQHVPVVASEEGVDHVVYRIHTSDKTPIYIPIEHRRRRR